MVDILDDELAAVMGHELSHALAKHANERISNQMLMQAGGQLLGATVGSRSGMLSGILNQAYGPRCSGRRTPPLRS